MTGTYLDPFILSEQEILAIYNVAKRHILEGKTIMNYSGEGDEVSSQFTAKPEDILREATWALKSKNPRKYGYIAQECRVFFG